MDNPLVLYLIWVGIIAYLAFLRPPTDLKIKSTLGNFGVEIREVTPELRTAFFRFERRSFILFLPVVGLFFWLPTGPGGENSGAIIFAAMAAQAAVCSVPLIFAVRKHAARESEAKLAEEKPKGETE